MRSNGHGNFLRNVGPGLMVARETVNRTIQNVLKVRQRQDLQSVSGLGHIVLWTQVIHTLLFAGSSH